MNRIDMVRLFSMILLGFLCVEGALFPEVTEPVVPALKRGFDTLQLGMTMEETEDRLKKSPYFDYRGPKDVSFLPLRSEPVIDTEGMRYIQRGIFQFQDDRLITIILYLNPKYIDYPSLFQHLSFRYGSPSYLDPRSCYWEDGSTRVALEKPLTIKFVDRKVLTAGKEEQPGLPFSPEEEGRRAFLELF
ncbi:MAG: hypothetical protein Kow009_11550 [Spirochaetales bacterium]